MRKQNFSAESNHKKRVGIHLMIPILFLLLGFTIFIYAGWNWFHQAYSLSNVLIQTNLPSTEDSQEVTPENSVKFPKLGEQFGTLSIPTAEIDYPVIQGDYDDQLARGIGHFDGSKFPGEGGNVIFDGHRETVFRNLGKVKVGDTVTLKTTYGVYTYKVSEIKIVKDTDKSILVPSETEKLTMYTCYPFDTIGYKPERYVVFADYVLGTPLKELLVEKGNK